MEQKGPNKYTIVYHINKIKCNQVLDELFLLKQGKSLSNPIRRDVLIIYNYKNIVIEIGGVFHCIKILYQYSSYLNFIKVFNILYRIIELIDNRSNDDKHDNINDYLTRLKTIFKRNDLEIYNQYKNSMISTYMVESYITIDICNDFNLYHRIGSNSIPTTSEVFKNEVFKNCYKIIQIENNFLFPLEFTYKQQQQQEQQLQHSIHYIRLEDYYHLVEYIFNDTEYYKEISESCREILLYPINRFKNVKAIVENE
jgi:hypothetical protein